jgi:hypothetical protein
MFAWKIIYSHSTYITFPFPFSYLALCKQQGWNTTQEEFAKFITQCIWNDLSVSLHLYTLLWLRVCDKEFTVKCDFQRESTGVNLFAGRFKTHLPFGLKNIFLEFAHNKLGALFILLQQPSSTPSWMCVCVFTLCARNLFIISSMPSSQYCFCAILPHTAGVLTETGFIINNAFRYNTRTHNTYFRRVHIFCVQYIYEL